MEAVIFGRGEVAIPAYNIVAELPKPSMFVSGVVWCCWGGHCMGCPCGP